MAIDPNIALGFRGIEVPNQLAQYAQIQQIQGAQQANQLNELKMAEYERARREEEGIRNYLAGNVNPTAPETRAGLLKFGKAGLEYGKLLNEADKAQAELGKVKAEAASKQTELFRGQLANVRTPEQAAQWVQAQYADPILAPIVKQVPMEQAIAGIPRDPKQFENWKNQNAIGMSKWAERNTMTAHEAEQLKVSQGQLAVSQGQLKVAQERETRLAQGPLGATLTPEQNDALFGENGAIAQGKINPNRINSRNAKMWADAFLKNPNVDPVKVSQDVAAADKAIKDFGTGEQGKKVTAFNTAIDHLATLDQLGAALKSGDVKLFNTLANTLAAQTGSAAPTSYNQAARIVGAEISKAIVPGVGTKAEREETANAFSSANSPEQLAAASATAKKLLGGQLSSLELQYKRTTKRNDFADQLLSPAAKAAYQSARVEPVATPAAPAASGGGIKFLGFEPGPAQ